MNDATSAYLVAHRDDAPGAIATALALDPLTYDLLTAEQVTAFLAALAKRQDAQALFVRMSQVGVAAQAAVQQALDDGTPLPTWEALIALALAAAAEA